MLSAAYAQGVRSVVASSHFYGDRESPEDFLARRERSVRELIDGGYSPDKGYPNIYLGAEVAFFIRRREAKYFPDLKIINAMSLGRAGVDCIEISDHCTACRQDLYWSARHTGNARGSQGAIIVCGEGTQ